MADEGFSQDFLDWYYSAQSEREIEQAKKIRENIKKWQQKHKELVAEQRRKYYHDHRDYFLEKAKLYYRKKKQH